MPEHIRALIVVLFLSIVVFAVARKPAVTLFGNVDFVRRCSLWLTLTLIAFLAHNFWIYMLLASLVLAFTRNREPRPVSLFLLLLFILPPSGLEIPGFGLINYFFTLTHQRMLALVILIPSFFALISRRTHRPFGSMTADKFLAGYLGLIILLSLRETTFTDTLRQLFYQFIDVFLPYFVISRSLRDMPSIRDALTCFVLAIMVLALIAVFESLKFWHLYSALEQVLEISSRLSGYDSRAGLLRASGPVDTIPLGYLMAVGIGLYLFVWRSIRSVPIRTGGLLLLISGLIAALSRGPWIGAICAYFVFMLAGRRPVTAFLKFFFVAILSIPLFILMPASDKLFDLLPYFGNIDQVNISYRERLLENSLIVINQHPLLGSIDYLETPEMQAMRQGQGIIDIVNSYIRVALESGYLGLFLFCGFFLSIVFGIRRAMRRAPASDADQKMLGRALLFALTAILVTIFTVSSISIIPIVYWSVAGFGVAYIALMERNGKTENPTNPTARGIDDFREPV